MPSRIPRLQESCLENCIKRGGGGGWQVRLLIVYNYQVSKNGKKERKHEIEQCYVFLYKPINLENKTNRNAVFKAGHWKKPRALFVTPHGKNGLNGSSRKFSLTESTCFPQRLWLNPAVTKKQPYLKPILSSSQTLMAKIGVGGNGSEHSTSL